MTGSSPPGGLSPGRFNESRRSGSQSASFEMTSRGGGPPNQGNDHLRPSLTTPASAAASQASTGRSWSSSRLSTYWEQPYGPGRDDGLLGPESPIDPTALQFALPPDINQPPPTTPRASISDDPYDTQPPDDDDPATDSLESDNVPLTSRAQPIAGSPLNRPAREAHPRSSFQTVSDIDNSPSRGRGTRSLGYGLDPTTSAGLRRGHALSLTPDQAVSRSRSPSTSDAFHRAGSMMRAMSQRVVNISGETELPDQHASHRRSCSPSDNGRGQRHNSGPILADTSSYPSQVFQNPPEKMGESTFIATEQHPTAYPSRLPMGNPLKGKSLGILSPDSVIRRKLCDMLVHPVTEPLILCLIMAQMVLLTIEAAPDVDEDGRPDRWAGGDRPWIDFAMLALFIIFTLEVTARIIVSGFILNASEYSTIDRKRGVRVAMREQYNNLFQPQRQKSVKASRQIHLGPSALARSITFMQGQPLPQTVEEHQRYQLARRAFLRHSFNRLDFLAVVSYWIYFLLAISGLEKEHHLYIFRMISCLRILRLLALTNGTAIILRSLKKAAPLLVRIAFLIMFFWLLFGIIGVQSFKSSLSRQCVWRDPEDPNNRTAAFLNDFQFCGGYLNETTGDPEPWAFVDIENDLSDESLRPGSLEGKGFLCPRGSLCLKGDNPHGGTVSFDNIFHSSEQVFVLMSSNTHTDIMYYLTDADYLPAALFYAAGFMILMLWLINLLIAVITSSFQVIREESRASAFTSDPEPSIQLQDDGPARKVSPLQKLYDKTSMVWIAVISFGLMAQCSRSATMPESRARFVYVAEIIVTILLDIEIAIRFAADWRAFHRTWRNLFDLFLAVITTIILIPPIRDSGQPYAWLTIFQILRIYRVVLAVPMTGKLIRQVLGSAAGIGNLILFVFLIAYIMAILASQLFRGEIDLDEDVAFHNIFNSFLGIWQVLSSEDWTDILYEVTETMAEWNMAWIGAAFFIGWFILSFFILINMFIAVIQENFDVSEDEKRMEQVKAFLQKKELGKSASNLALSTIFTLGRSRRKKDPLDYGPATMEMLLKDAVVRDFLDDTDESSPATANGGGPQAPPRAQTLAVGDVQPGLISRWWGQLVSRLSGREPNPFYSNIQFDRMNETLDPRQMARQAVSATSARRKAQREYLARHPNYNTSLFIFTPKNPIRRACQRLVGPGRGSERFDGVEPNKIAWYAFSIFTYATIVAMVVIACVTTPLYQKEYQEQNPEFSITFWYVWTDMAFAIVFLAEAIIKVIADGFFWTPNAYYRSSWGIIDGVVLISLLINVGSLIKQDGEVSRAIGAFKALRALRLLNVSDSARDTFHSLIIVGWWKILSAAFVSISLLIPFAVYGLNLWNGLMISCNDDGSGITDLQDCYGEYNSTPLDNDDWPMLAPRVADNDYFNFDDFGNSIFILFSILSQEGWVDVSFAAQAVTSRGQQPEDQNSEGNAVFFVIYNLLGTVFVLALFIAVFMRNYTEQTGVAFLTAEQRSWLELRKLLQHISPSKTSYSDSGKSWKKWCHKRAIEKRGKWHQGVTCVLVFHLILLTLEYDGEPEWWSRMRDFLFLGCVFVYMANVFIRLFGLGWSRFRRSSWDLYSLPVVAGAFVSTTILIIVRGIDGGTLLEGETYVQVHKSFLVAIVLLLIPRNDALDQLFKTAAASLTTIGNLLATWLVLFLVFAIALTQAFSLTRFGENEDSNINFRTVPHALILLYRMSCGEGWNILMEDFANIEPPLCTVSDDFFQSDCGSKPWARFLFVAWNILSMYIFVNLFVSLIYESFSYVYQRSSGLAAVDRDEIRRFKEAWRSVDPAGTGFITKEQFPRLLGELSGIFEMRIYDAEDSVHRILEDVRNEAPAARHASVATSSSAYAGLDLRRLNERLAQLDVEKIRERRRRFNIFFEEVMVSADPDKGIAFGQVLMILAHYNIINDSKSLRLEEFLRRRARLQRVDEEVRRRIVLGFFDTLYYSRQFKRHMDRKRSARMTDVPQLDIPHIFVDEGDGTGNKKQAAPSSPGDAASDAGSKGKSAMLSAEDAVQHTRSRGWSGSSDLSSFDTSAWHHPLASPRSGPPSPSHHSGHSAYSFDLQEPGGSGGSRPGSGENSRRSSAVSPAQVSDMLDDSIWLESIRRSATTKKSSDRGSY